jgi:hypothetical protein
MSSTTVISTTARRITRPNYRGIARIALAAAVLVGGARAADAQTTTPQNTADAQVTTPQNTADAQATGAQRPRWEFDIIEGTVVPTAQRDPVKRANITAAQLSYVVRPDFAITATLGWARSRDLHSIGEPRLDVFTYDVGAEVRTPRWKAGRVITFSPFAGGGAGARSYNYRHLDVDATHNVAAYLSAGCEFGIHHVLLRLEVRNYVTGFKPLNGGGKADTRNDVVVMTGLRFARR